MYLLFDIGGTKMRLAISADGQVFSEPEIVATPASPEDLIKTVQMVAERLCQNGQIKNVVGGITRKRLAVQAGLEKLFNCPTIIENDTALVGLGETVYGAGQGRNLVAYITVSTGVGGVRLVGGQIDKSANGFEPGHQIIDLNVPERHLEDYISGTAVQASTGQAPKTISDQVFWSNLSKIAAVGIYNTIVHWSPELVVLGGSMFHQPGLVIAEIQSELDRLTRDILKPLPELRLAKLEDLGGLYGALALARQKFPL